MKVPSFLYGRYAEVKRRCRSKARLLSKGASLVDLAEGDEVDVATCPGWVVLEGPSPLLGAAPQFNCYVLTREVFDSKPDLKTPVLERYFSESLELDWALVGLLGQDAYSFVRTADHQRRLLLALVSAWTRLEAVGPRYSMGMPAGDRLWKALAMAGPACYSLARLGGFRNEELMASFGPEFIPRLMSRLKLPRGRARKRRDGTR